MYFLLKIVIFQPAMLVCQRVYTMYTYIYIFIHIYIYPFIIMSPVPNLENCELMRNHLRKKKKTVQFKGEIGEF